ncbi:MAG: TetR/AcrR family transcriptional regulator [Clostridium sp.]
MEKKQTRKEQALQTRSNILTVCTGLLREHTFDELSISMICREADISVGAFYHHFKTKSDIIVELCRDVDDVFVNDILPVCRQLPPWKRFCSIFANNAAMRKQWESTALKMYTKHRLIMEIHFLRPMSAVCPMVFVSFFFVR